MSTPPTCRSSRPRAAGWPPARSPRSRPARWINLAHSYFLTSLLPWRALAIPLEVPDAPGRRQERRVAGRPASGVERGDALAQGGALAPAPRRVGADGDADRLQLAGVRDGGWLRAGRAPRRRRPAGRPADGRGRRPGRGVCRSSRHRPRRWCPTANSPPAATSPRAWPASS